MILAKICPNIENYHQDLILIKISILILMNILKILKKRHKIVIIRINYKLLSIITIKKSILKNQ